MKKNIYDFNLQLFADGGGGSGAEGGASTADATTTTETSGDGAEATATTETTEDANSSDWGESEDGFEAYLNNLDNTDDDANNEAKESLSKVTEDAENIDNEESSESEMPEIFKNFEKSLESEGDNTGEAKENVARSSYLSKITTKAEANAVVDEEGGNKADENLEDGDNKTDEEVKEKTIEDELSSEDFMEKLYENPQKVISEIAQKIADKKVNRALTEKEQEYKSKEEEQGKWNKIADEFTEQHPDYTEYSETMLDIMENSDLDLNGKEHAYETAYHIARSLEMGEIPKMPNNSEMLKTVLGDDETKQQILDNEDIQKAIISEYLKNVNNKDSIRSISNKKNKGEQPSNATKKKAQSFDEAEEMMMNEFN